jgi:hypothetical protein
MDAIDVAARGNFFSWDLILAHTGESAYEFQKIVIAPLLGVRWQKRCD